MMNVHVSRCDNSEVTDFYLDIVNSAFCKALKAKGVDCVSDDIVRVRDAFGYSKSDWFIVATCLAALKLWVRGYKNIIVWFQGIDPEESFMRNNSRLRYHVLSWVEKFVLKHAKFKLFVSKEMIRHYEKKYNISIGEEESMVIPCFNDKLDLSSFEKVGKYTANKFCYVGSTAKWQKFESIISLYKNIEKTMGDCSLTVLTADVEYAEEVIRERCIEHYVIKHVKPEEVSKEICECKFGFIIRDNCAVNRVSTPTKISNYMASGVIPIFSSCICDFAEVSDQMKYVIKVDDYSDAEAVIGSIKQLQNIDVMKIRNEYREIFACYYNDERYCEELATKLSARLL